MLVASSIDPFGRRRQLPGPDEASKRDQFEAQFHVLSAELPVAFPMASSEILDQIAFLVKRLVSNFMVECRYAAWSAHEMGN